MGCCDMCAPSSTMHSKQLESRNVGFVAIRSICKAMSVVSRPFSGVREQAASFLVIPVTAV